MKKKREIDDCSKAKLYYNFNKVGTTGQNAVSQAKLFGQAVPVDGIVVTKLDGTAKGGVVISIKEELGVPVRWIGVGEGVDDLRPFTAKEFASALFDKGEQEE